MIFSHRTDATRAAHVTELEEPAGVRIEHTDAAGKARKKTIKAAGAFQPMTGARHKALRFLLGEGFILREQETGVLRWLTQTDEPFPHGFVALETRGEVWVGETGFLRRVTPGTCEQLDLALPSGAMPMALTASDSLVFAWVRHDSGAEQGAGPLLPPAAEDAQRSSVIASTGKPPETLFTLDFDPRADVLSSLSATTSGELLGPHASGVGLYTRGTCTAFWPAAPTQHQSPVAGISPDGKTIAITAPDGAIRIEGERPRVVPVGFSQVHHIWATNSGTVWVAGCGPDFWGVYRIVDSEWERVSEVIHARPSQDESTIVEAAAGRLRERSITGATSGDLLREVEIPWAGMAKAGIPLRIQDSAAIVRTDAVTIAEIHWPA